MLYYSTPTVVGFFFFVFNALFSSVLIMFNKDFHLFNA